MANPPSPSPRHAALRVLRSIGRERLRMDEAFARAPMAGEAADAKFARLLVLSVLRHWGQLDAVLAHYLQNPLPEKRDAVQWALRMGAAQLLLLDTPPHAAVNETVGLLKKGPDAGFVGLTNAVLQKIAREKPPLPDALHNLPGGLAHRWVSIYGEAAVRRMAALGAQRPPLDLNTETPMDGGHRMDARILRLGADHPAVETLNGYEAGTFFVQDVAASYPVRLLGELRGQRVLDLCAAPGGKTAQLAQGGADVVALDRSAARMVRLRSNMARLKLDVETVTADAFDWHPVMPFDAILVDAPCSATGTWRRHPEVLRIVSPADIATLVALQRRLLARAWQWLKPGGRLVYCTCSLEPEEGEAQAGWFLQNHPDATRLPMEGAGIPAECLRDGMLRTLPSHRADEGGMDGFFAVLLQKNTP